MKRCPSCGYEGTIEFCPNDGERLLSPDDLKERSGVDVTVAPGPESSGATPTQALPYSPRVAERLASGTEDATIADVGLEGSISESFDVHLEMHPADPAMEASEHGLRDENFGKWDAPELPKKEKGDPLIGRTIAGRYEVLSLLGQGGMGAVYKCKQPAVQRFIALKTLLKEFADNETIIKRFHQEALAASRLTHPNTISIYDFGQTEDNVLYMAMEYLKGEGLAQAIKRSGPMPPKRVLHIMRQCCKSLSEAHQAGIVHRDLKPDNIFLTEVRGEHDFVKVLDFGVAKLREYEGKEGTLTQAGMIFGTPKYMSPEQARSGDLDGRSDIYALGVILYEMLMGKPPFTGDNPLGILIAQVNEQPDPFGLFNPHVQVPPPLESIVFKALSKNPDDRHADIDELHEELAACDELLDGASYESVADRLPATLPGQDGMPSWGGPALVPEGSEGTLPSGGESVQGGTLALDGDGQPLPGPAPGVELTDALSDRAFAPKRRAPLLIAMGALPVLAIGGWALSRSEPKAPAVQPLAATPPDAARVAIASAKPDAAAEPSKPAPPEPRPEPLPETQGTEILLSVKQKGVSVFNAATGEIVGLANPTMKKRYLEKTTLLLRKSGYRDLEVVIDPAAGKTLYNTRLKPVARRRRRKPPPVATTSPTPTPVIVVDPQPARRRRRGRRDISLR